MEQEKVKKIIEDVKKLADAYSAKPTESTKIVLEAIQKVVSITLEEEGE